MQHFVRSNSGHGKTKDDQLPQADRLYIFFSWDVKVSTLFGTHSLSFRPFISGTLAHQIFKALDLSIEFIIFYVLRSTRDPYPNFMLFFRHSVQ